MSQFEKELRELMKKHNVIVVVDDHYDGEEEYMGSSCRFVGAGVDIECESLEKNSQYNTRPTPASSGHAPSALR